MHTLVCTLDHLAAARRIHALLMRSTTKQNLHKSEVLTVFVEIDTSRNTNPASRNQDGWVGRKYHSASSTKTNRRENLRKEISCSQWEQDLTYPHGVGCGW